MRHIHNESGRYQNLVGKVLAVNVCCYCWVIIHPLACNVQQPRKKALSLRHSKVSHLIGDVMDVHERALKKTWLRPKAVRAITGVLRAHEVRFIVD